MKLSNKNRLMSMHRELFPDDTLFHRIARAVCRVGVLLRKELCETRQSPATHDFDPIPPGQRLNTPEAQKNS